MTSALIQRILLWLLFSVGLWVQRPEEVDCFRSNWHWMNFGGGVVQNYRRKDKKSGQVLVLFGWMVRATALGFVLRENVCNRAGSRSLPWACKMKLPATAGPASLTEVTRKSVWHPNCELKCVLG